MNSRTRWGGLLDKISKFLRDTAPVPVSPRRASARGYPPSRKFTALVYPRINKYNGAFRDFLLVTSPVCDTFPSTVLARLTRPAGAVFLQVSIQVSKSSPSLSLCLSNTCHGTRWLNGQANTRDIVSRCDYNPCARQVIASHLRFDAFREYVASNKHLPVYEKERKSFRIN